MMIWDRGRVFACSQELLCFIPSFCTTERHFFVVIMKNSTQPLQLFQSESGIFPFQRIHLKSKDGRSHIFAQILRAAFLQLAALSGSSGALCHQGPAHWQLPS